MLKEIMEKIENQKPKKFLWNKLTLKNLRIFTLK
jgi:hypothetical protein